MMPGLGASPNIFKGLVVPDTYRIKYLHWMMPKQEESLTHYVQRLIETQMDATDVSPILAGMSFGGIIVNEISKQIPVKALIFISTTKSKQELPPKITLGRWLRVYRWFPFKIIENPIQLKDYLPSKAWKKRMVLYDRYMEVKDSDYFSWSVERILKWQGDLPHIPFVHIHGEKDLMFPFKYIQKPVKVIKGASHLAVMTHPKQISAYMLDFLEELA